MSESRPKAHANDPFQASLGVLLSIAKDEAGAVGFALYQCDVNQETLVLRCAQGLPARAPGRFPLTATQTPLRLLAPAGEDGLAILSFPLPAREGLAGVLDFGFREPRDFSAAQRDVLEFTANAVGQLLRREGTAPLLMQLTARIVELETKLADLKISERAQGLARQESHHRRSAILGAHVASVLDSSELEKTLTLQLRTLEQKLEERRVIAQAKELLQCNLQLTEEESYRRLRDASRRTRARLVTVAADVLMGRLRPEDFS